MILVSMDRGDRTLYYRTKQLYFGHVNFKFTGGGNHHPPFLGRRVTKKGSGRRGLKLLKMVLVELMTIYVVKYNDSFGFFLCIGK